MGKKGVYRPRVPKVQGQYMMIILVLDKMGWSVADQLCFGTESVCEAKKWSMKRSKDEDRRTLSDLDDF